MSAIDIPGPEAEGGAELTKAAILATGLGAAGAHDSPGPMGPGAGTIGPVPSVAFFNGLTW